MEQIISKEIRLKKRPSGMVSAEDFELAEVRVPQTGEGQALVRNIYISVDPYMRGRMSEAKSYVAPFELDKPMEGGCVGQVVSSGLAGFNRGDYVLGSKGWREYYVSDGTDLTRIDPGLAPDTELPRSSRHDRFDRLCGFTGDRQTLGRGYGVRLGRIRGGWFDCLTDSENKGLPRCRERRVG